ncbi:MAG: helix-turn-helix domain-containing protein [Gammaproteobacteria bacterium]|nr:helix-turn-helix domain-containing protein [Gammaproteobacteria bacterium]
MAERADYWRHAVCSEFVSLEPVPLEPARFYGNIRSRHLGPLSISDIHAAAQTVHRGRRQIAATPGEYFFLIVQSSGVAHISQNGRDARLLPGDAIIVDSRRPYTFSFNRDFEQINVSIPVNCVTEHTRRRIHTGIRLENMGPLLGAYLAVLADRDAREDGGWLQLAANKLVEMINVLSEGSALPLRNASDPRLQFIKAFVARHYTDPALCTASVATAGHISTRLLHKLFSREGETFGGFLRRLRLERSRDALRRSDPGRTIISIAMDSGFDSLSSFSRAFRKQFGLTPSQFRNDWRQS